MFVVGTQEAEIHREKRADWAGRGGGFHSETAGRRFRR